MGGFIWFRIGISGGLLWTREWTFGLPIMLPNSWEVEQLLASQYGLTSMELVSNRICIIKTLNITPCSPLKINRRFGGACRLHLQWQIISRERNQRENRWQAGLGLFFGPEDGSDMFLRNFGWLSTDTPEDSTFHYHRCENLKSYTIKTLMNAKLVLPVCIWIVIYKRYAGA
jgi:hypothetical protein